MARQKRTSPVLDKAVERASGLKSIDAALDLGGGLTLDAYQQEIEALRTLLDQYNTLLSTADTMNNALVKLEKELADLSERMLSGVGSRYGKDSSEYEQAGGTRKSEKKKPVRKAKG